MIKKVHFYPMAMKLILLLLSNNKSAMRYQYLVYYIIQNTYKTNERRRTTISISDIYNDILHNVKEINSFGGHLANYICIVLMTMLTHCHPIFLNI